MKLTDTTGDFAGRLKYGCVTSCVLIGDFFEVRTWCVENGSTGMFAAYTNYTGTGNLVHWRFEKEEDVILFALRWS